MKNLLALFWTVAKSRVTGVTHPLILFAFIAQTISPLTPAHAQSSGQEQRQANTSDSYLLKKDDASQKTGSVYFTSNKKNEVLFKANIWGAVQFPGVHYIPLGTRFLEAISIAGGPLDSGDTENVVLSSKRPGAEGTLVSQISIEQALANEKFNPALQADDIILVKEDNTYRDATLYLQIGTFLVSVAVFALLVNRR